MWSPAQADSLFSDPPTMRQDVVPVHRAEPTVARQPDTDGLGRDFDSPPSGEVTVPGYLPALDHGRPALNDAVQRQSATAGPRADVMPKGGVPLRDTVAGAPAPMETESAERPSRERRRPPPPRMPVLRRTRARRNLAH